MSEIERLVDEYALHLANRVHEQATANVHTAPPLISKLDLEWSARNALLAAFERVEAQYNELLFAVETKYPDESRHDTALRYIRRAECPSNANDAKAVAAIDEAMQS